MAETATKNRIVYNRSQANRAYIISGKGKDVKKLLAGNSMEVTQAEFDQLTKYKDIVDAERMVPAAAKRQEEALRQNAQLRTQLAELQDDPVIAERLREIAAAKKQEQGKSKEEKKEKPKKGGK